LKEAQDCHGNGAIEVEALRDIADDKLIGADQITSREVFETQQQADKRRFPSAVRTNDGHDLAGGDVDIHVVKDAAPVPLEGETSRRDERTGAVGLERSPMIMIVMKVGVIVWRVACIVGHRDHAAPHGRQVPDTSITVRSGLKPLPRSASAMVACTLAPSISVTAPQRAQ
jgi:hypothetical protein